MSEKSLFVLVPPHRYTLNMPNLGDVALQQGMKNLLCKSYGGQLVYDEWNSFPRKTLRRLCAGSQSSVQRWAHWQDGYRRQVQSEASVQQALSSLLFGPALEWLPLWSPLDREALRRTGQTGREALSPRVFPMLAARKFAQNLASCDAVVMNAGGLLADHLAHYLPSRMFALDAAHQAMRPTALVNYSFAVTRPDLLVWVAPVMRAVTIHAVRETLSRDRLLSIGVAPERITVVPDAAFATDVPVAKKKTTDQLVIAIQVRGDRQTDISAWAALIKRMRADFNARVVYLCGCRKYDPPVRASLQLATGLDLAGEDDHLDTLRASIGQADLLLSDRYHGAVFATQMGTAFVPLMATTHKTAGFIADLDYATPVLPPLARGGIEFVLSTVGALLTRRNKVGDELRGKAQNLRSRLFDDYHSIVEQLLSARDSSRSNLE